MGLAGLNVADPIGHWKDSPFLCLCQLQPQQPARLPEGKQQAHAKSQIPKLGLNRQLICRGKPSFQGVLADPCLGSAFHYIPWLCSGRRPERLREERDSRCIRHEHQRVEGLHLPGCQVRISAFWRPPVTWTRCRPCIGLPRGLLRNVGVVLSIQLSSSVHPCSYALSSAQAIVALISLLYTT